MKLRNLMRDENNYTLEPNNREAWFLLFIIFAIYNLVKLSYIRYSLSDENTYFYMGKLVSEGFLPYKDFFFAHPPLKLIPPAIIFYFFGFNFFILKLIPVIATNITAVFIFSIGRRALGNLYGIFATSLFLFSFSGLYYTSYFMGTNLTTTFAIIALYLYSKGNNFSSGALLGLALLTGLYSICSLIAIGFYIMLINRRAFGNFISGFLLIFISLNILLILFFHERYYIPVYIYHFLKAPDITNPKYKILADMLKLNIFLLCPSFLYPFFRIKKLDLPFLIAIAYIFLFSGFKSIHDYYFVLSTPFFAIAGSHVILSLLKRLRLSYPTFLLSAFITLALFAKIDIDKSRDSIRLSSIPQAPEMAQKIQKAIAPDKEIYGLGEIVPLIALLSDLHVYNNQVDANEKIYITGITNLDNIRDDILNKKLELIIAREIQVSSNTSIFYGPMVDENFRRFLWEKCEPILTYCKESNPNDKIIVFKLDIEKTS